MSNLIFKIYLQSIQYDGDNIGNDLSIDIRVLRTNYSFELDLKNGKSITFATPLFIAEEKLEQDIKELRRLVKIKITERDISIDDQGESKQYYIFKVDSDNELQFSQKVGVKENYNQPQDPKEAAFILTFVGTFLKKGKDGYAHMRLPKLVSATIFKRITHYEDWNYCNKDCLKRCIVSRYNINKCMKNCCNKTV